MSAFTAPAFKQGYDACKDAKPRSANPYTVPPMRLAWAEGYAERAKEEAASALDASKS